MSIIGSSTLIILFAGLRCIFGHLIIACHHATVDALVAGRCRRQSSSTATTTATATKTTDNWRPCRSRSFPSSSSSSLAAGQLRVTCCRVPPPRVTFRRAAAARVQTMATVRRAVAIVVNVVIRSAVAIVVNVVVRRAVAIRRGVAIVIVNVVVRRIVTIVVDVIIHRAVAIIVVDFVVRCRGWR
jgi:hypothetical protein